MQRIDHAGAQLVHVLDQAHLIWVLPGHSKRIFVCELICIIRGLSEKGKRSWYEFGVYLRGGLSAC